MNLGSRQGWRHRLLRQVWHVRKVQVGNRDRRPSSWPTLRVRPVQSISIVALMLVSLLGSGLLWTLATPVGATATTYYVDCSAGNDNNPGTSTDAAWKTITRANKAKLQPGDSLLLKRGCTWSEQLKAKWNGTASQPIVIGAYGSGDLPLLENTTNGNVYISGSYQTIEYLQTANAPGSYGQIVASCNNQPVGWVVGFNFVGAEHDTVRYSLATHEAIGAAFTANSNNNHLLHNQIINNDGAWEAPSSSQGLRGGTGVNLRGTGNEIAYNHFAGNHTLCDDESISIELYTASNSNVHHNTTYGDKDFVELGSNSSFQSSDNTFAYNVHTTAAAHSRFVVTRGQGDAHGPVWRTSVFNNDVYYTGSDSQGVVCSRCGTDVLRLENNIIDVVTKALYVAPQDGAVVSNNIFWSPVGKPPKNNFVQTMSAISSSSIANPQFVDPSGNDFDLQSSSPAIGAGSMDSVNAGYSTDLGGTSVPQNGAVDIGAYEGGGGASSQGSNPTPTPTPAQPTSQKPPTSSGTTTNLPGTIQAEDYNAGGDGTGYHDTTPANLGNAYRSDGVDVQPCTDATTPSGQKCYNVGWPAAGEWLAYDVNVKSGGTFHITARVASTYGDRSFHVTVDGKNVTGTIVVPNTGSWQSWTDVTSKAFSLSAGTHTLKIVDESDGFNINYFKVTQ